MRHASHIARRLLITWCRDTKPQNSTFASSIKHETSPHHLELKHPSPSPPQQHWACRQFSSSATTPTTATTASTSSGWAQYLLLIPPVITACLCKWQLDRRQWKMDLLQQRQRIMKGNPLDIFSDDMPPPEEYQRVRATGTFDYARTQYIGPRPRSRMGTTEIGYLAVTPLISSTPSTTATNRQIMVLRGWVPAEWRRQQEEKPGPPPPRNKQGQPAGTVTVEGVVRIGEDPGVFVPDNDPKQGTWFYISGKELARAAGLPEETPLVEVVSAEENKRMMDTGPTVMDVLGGRGKLPPAPVEEYPLPKSEGDMGAFSVMPGDHANYAATWAALTVATGVMAVMAMRKKTAAALRHRKKLI